MRDGNGMAEGGLRHVFVQVPVEYNSSTGCPLYGTYTAWSAAQIRSLYKTHASYVAKIRAWTAHEVRRGWLLRRDRRSVLREAAGFSAPWTGGCSDTCRAPLGLSSESVYLLPELDRLATEELFVQRARAARPDADLPAEAVSELCARLEGLPRSR